VDGALCDDGLEGTSPDVCRSGVCEGQSLYAFQGFFRPVAVWPQLTDAAPGASVHLKFSLGGYHGFDFALGGGPVSAPVDCGTLADVGPWEAVNAEKPLSYDADADRYKYSWKTDRAWSGTCRRVLLELDDGSVHSANFYFRANGRSRDQ
jgi:hypothetical protein